MLEFFQVIVMQMMGLSTIVDILLFGGLFDHVAI